MLKAYLKTLVSLPSTALDEIGKVKSTCGLVFSLLLVFNKQLADALKITWKGISPWWGIFLMFLVAIHVLIRRNIKLEEKQKPQLEILYGNKDSFVQLDRFGPDVQRLVRIAVKNISNTTIRGIRVQLEKIVGQDTSFLPINLHLMHDNPNEENEYRQEFDLHPGERQFVDVAMKMERGPNYKGNIILGYATKGVPNQLQANRYELLIKVVGTDVQSSGKEFVLDINKKGELSFVPKETG